MKLRFKYDTVWLSVICVTSVLAMPGCTNTFRRGQSTPTTGTPASIDFGGLGITSPPEVTVSDTGDAPTKARKPPAGSETVTIRGQDPGYAMPPVATPSPGGGGYLRGPQPVSGQNVQPAINRIAQTDSFGATRIGTDFTGGAVQPAQYTMPSNLATANPAGAPAAGAQSRVAQLTPTQVQPAAPPTGAPYSGGPSPSYTAPAYQPPAQPNIIGVTPEQITPPQPQFQPQPLPPPQQQYAPAPAPAQNYSAQPPQTYAPAQNFQNQQPVPPRPVFETEPLDGQTIGPIDPLAGFGNEVPPPLVPRVRTVPVDVFVTPARTGRFMIGGAVNSDAGVTGQIVLDERNFDIMRFPRSFQDLFSGYAFRGAGQTFRLEAVPGSEFQRYMMSFGQPYLFGYLPISLSLQAFLFDRRYRDWDESRLGGRLQLGYRLTNELSLSGAVRGESVDFNNVRIPGADPFVDSFIGQHDLYSGSVRMTHDTRDIPFAPTEGHLIELSYEQAFGSYSYSRWQADWRQYFLLRERADRSGRHTVAFSNRLGLSGRDTPIFENFFAGGYSTIRGFDFRGASPKSANGADIQVGGRLSLLGSVEYQFPLTADDATKGVVFVDYGTVERGHKLERENFRVAPGFGFRVSMPALGPAPLAFDFAFPVAHADTDERQVFSFFMGFTR